MITRKIWFGDILMLAAGNSFWRDQVVTHRAGMAIAHETCEEGDPLVFIAGNYWVKREDLRELDPSEGRVVTLMGELGIPEALNGIGHLERLQMAQELEAMERERPFIS